jgi:threonine dehydrogenase-like Zn-dependent dehydrogenase
VVVGLCMAADRFFPAKAITKELDLTFVFVYRRRDFEIVVDLLGRGRIAAAGLVTDRVGFDTFSHAFEALKKPSDQIKVMLEPH